MLNDDQKQNSLSVYKDLQDEDKKDRNLLSKVTRADESWIYGYESETRIPWKLKVNRRQC
jgi:hypothetical protein